MKNEDTRNLFLAIALSVLVMAAWQYFYAGPLYQRQHQAQLQAQSQAQSQTSEASQPAGAAAPGSSAVSAPGGGGGSVAASTASVPEALAATPRVAIDTPSVAGSIDLKGGKLDDLVLKDYRETINKNSPLIRLLSPGGAPNGYWATTGFVSPAGAKTPTLDTVWTADVKTMTPSHPATLTWDNGEGLLFKRVIAIDDKFMFTVTDTVTNKGASPASVRPYGMVLRHGKPPVAGYSVLHEGFVGVIGDGGVQQVTYAGIEKATDKTDTYSGPGGWLGFTDKYWGTAIIPNQSEPIDARFSASGTGQPLDYQADFVGPEKTVAPGETTEIDDAGVRRRQGSRHDRQLRDQARHQEVRPDDRLGLVLFHHQAALSAD